MAAHHTLQIKLWGKLAQPLNLQFVLMTDSPQAYLRWSPSKVRLIDIGKMSAVREHA